MIFYLLIILKFFIGLIFLLAFGNVIGHLLELNKNYKDMQKHKNKNIQKQN